MPVSLFMLTQGACGGRREPALADARYGYGPSGNHRWLSAGLSLGIAGVVGSALVLALVAPEIVDGVDPPFIGTMLDLPLPPPPPDPDEQVQDPVVPAETRITTVPREPLLPPIGSGPTIYFDPQPWQPPIPDVGSGAEAGGTAIPDPVPPNPVLRDAVRDPRYAAAFQPPYPPALERERIEGSARVRVRIGTNGRVISVEDAGSSDPRFFAATQRQALRSWRFEAATRDGVAVESTQVLTVQFRMPAD